MLKSASKNSINKNTHLVAYNKEEIKQLGTCVLKVNYGGKTLPQEFFMVGSGFKPIVGLDASHRLGLLTVNCTVYQSWTRNYSIDSISGADADIPKTISKDWIANNPKYKHLFQGIGRFKCDPVQIKLTQNATPVQKPPRRVPLALKDQFKQELDNMVSQGILSKLDDANVNAPEWLNSFVVLKKPNGKLQICLDLTDLNPFIVRPVCNARTLDEITALLKDAVHFTVFDGIKGFFHVPLDKASKMLTAMLTPVGIYIYNVLAMGLSNATDIFESCIHQILEGLNGTINIADDVLVFGCDYDSFKSNVISFLDQCVEKDLHLNPDKIQINIPDVPFFGQVLTKEGLRPDPHKVDVIKQCPTATDVTELQSFLGSVNYLCKFIPYLSDLRQPLQGLLKSDSEFLWTQVHDKAFKNLKQAICKDITLQFFDSDLPLYIEADASQKGIGAAMVQPDKRCKNTSTTGIPSNLRPVAYTSKTFTSCESNYSNIERELLGVLFSVLHFKHFTYGCKVYVITDHKPLVSLFRKSLTSASPRLPRMLLHVLDYQLDVMYQPGTKMHLSDALSRLTSHNNNSKVEPIKGLDVTVHDVQIFRDITPVSRKNQACH